MPVLSHEGGSQNEVEGPVLSHDGDSQNEVGRARSRNHFMPMLAEIRLQSKDVQEQNNQECLDFLNTATAQNAANFPNAFKA